MRLATDPTQKTGMETPTRPANIKARSMTELLARPQSDRTILRAGQPLTATLPDFREMDPIVGAP